MGDCKSIPLVAEVPTHEFIDGRLLLPRSPILTQGTFSSMASISGCSDSVPQQQLALGVSSSYISEVRRNSTTLLLLTEVVSGALASSISALAWNQHTGTLGASGQFESPYTFTS